MTVSEGLFSVSVGYFVWMRVGGALFCVGGGRWVIIFSRVGRKIFWVSGGGCTV